MSDENRSCVVLDVIDVLVAVPRQRVPVPQLRFYIYMFVFRVVLLSLVGPVFISVFTRKKCDARVLSCTLDAPQYLALGSSSVVTFFA